MRLLSWNLDLRPNWRVVGEVLNENDVDVAVVIESPKPRAADTMALNSGANIYHVSTAGASSVFFVINARTCSIGPIHDDELFSIVKISHKSGVEFSLVGVHLWSKLHTEPPDRHELAIMVAQEIRLHVHTAFEPRYIIMGDFNMDPFEPGIRGASGFHATMSRPIAQSESRKVAKKKMPILYNPSWSAFATQTSDVYGSYYYRSGKPDTQFWHMLDQALVSPSLLQYVADPAVRLVSSTSSTSLRSARGLLSKSTVSDHLPILLRLETIK